MHTNTFLGNIKMDEEYVHTVDVGYGKHIEVTTGGQARIGGQLGSAGAGTVTLETRLGQEELGQLHNGAAEEYQCCCLLWLL